MAILFIITHELVTLEQVISKRNYSHLYNNGIATSELTIDHHFWSQFAFLHGSEDGNRSHDLYILGPCRCHYTTGAYSAKA